MNKHQSRSPSDPGNESFSMEERVQCGSTGARLNRDPLWLIVGRDGKNTAYEFPSDGDTTVVIGSSERAQICIAKAAPIAFYVERVENDLCITSCYLGSDLCADGRVVRGRRVIVESATVEVAGERLVLAVRDDPPTLPGYYVDAAGDRVSSSEASLTSSPVAAEPSAARSLSREKASDGANETEWIVSGNSVSSTTVPPQKPSELSELPVTADSSGTARDAYLSALDSWFDATFPRDTDATNVPGKLAQPKGEHPKLDGPKLAHPKLDGPKLAHPKLDGPKLDGPKLAHPKLDGPSALRTNPASLKQVTVPPRPRPTVRRPYSDFAQTQELAPIRLMAITEELKTIELGQRIRESDPGLPSNSESIGRRGTADSESPPSNCHSSTFGDAEAPTERVIRTGSITSAPKSGSEPVATPTSAQSNTTPRLLPSAPPRKRRPLLFLLGAVLGTLLPALCLVGVGRLAVLSRNALGSRAHSTYAAASGALHSPTAPAVSTTGVSAALQPSAVTSAISSANRVPIQPPRISRKHPRAAASAR